MGLSRSTAAFESASRALAGVTMHYRVTVRKILMRGLLAIGILAAAVLLFFAGDHDDPEQDGPKPTVGAHHPSE
jgi:hypothetical protein